MVGGEDPAEAGGEEVWGGGEAAEGSEDLAAAAAEAEARQEAGRLEERDG